MSVRVKDNGAARVVRLLSRDRDPWVVYVGVIGNKATREKAPGVTVADVATWAELGLGQPMRSWLRGYIDENLQEIQAVMRREARAVLEDKRTARVAMRRLGAYLVGEIKQRIADRIDPPNAPSTVARKGSDVPLINTGQFRTSITSRVQSV